ncbi:MAG: extracellular solute-binding protein [Clostridiales bacterium]|jgi:multiple sugar transport system substrate-binding protein|nr:extracellular solute-binding protein [Clostridiales bacterium]
MQIKKRVLTILSGFVLAFAFAACGVADDPTPAATPTPEAAQPAQATPTPQPEPADDPVDMVLAWWGNPTRNEQTTEAVALFMSEFPHVTVEEQTVGWGDYWALLGTMAVGGDLPDVIQMDWAFLEQYVGNNLLVDLRPFIDDGTIDLSDVPQSVIETGRIGEGIYAVSIGMNGASMIYNQTLLESIGITMSHNTTMDEFIEIARQVYAETGFRTNLVYTDPSNPLEVHLRARGITMLTPEGMGGTVQDYVDFFEIIEMGIQEGWHIHPEAMVGRDGMEQDPMVYGGDPSQMSWMGLFFSNMMTGMMNVAPEGMQMGMTTYPSENPQLSNYIRASMYFSITTQSDNPQTAAEFINFWTNSIEVNRIIMAERGIPASAVVADAIAPDFNEANQIASYFVDFVGQPGNSTPVNPPRPEGAGEIVDNLRLMMENVGHGAMTAQEAAEAFFNFGNSILN